MGGPSRAPSSSRAPTAFAVRVIARTIVKGTTMSAIHQRIDQTAPTPAAERPGTRTRGRVRLSLGAISALSALALVGCSASPSANPGTTEGASSTSAVASTAPAGTTAPDGERASLEVHDAWVKAAEAGSMTAAFGVLRNTTDHPVTVRSVSTAASPMAQLHEMAPDGHGGKVMREAQQGFTIEPHAEFVLQPGGNHLMLMHLPEAIRPGQTVTFELSLDDGSTVSLEATVKDFTGANENYTPTPSH